jgi:hypothetical protein
MTARTAPNSYSVAFWPPGLLMLPAPSTLPYAFS